MATNPVNPNPQQPTATQQPQPNPQPQTQPGTQPVTAPVTDMNSLTPEQLRQIATGTQPASQQQPIMLPGTEQLQDGTLQLKLPTGQVYRGRDATELFNQVVQGQVNASQRITEMSQERERINAAINAIGGRTPAGQAQEQFDRAVYMELQQVDPIAAQNYLDQYRFGLTSINEVVPYYQNTFRAAQEFQTAQTVNNFRAARPDFPGTREAVDLIIGFMKENNIPFSANNLALVHDGMVKANKYQPLTVQQNSAMTMQPQPGTAGQPGQPVAQPPQNPGFFDVNPQGNYSFGPNGFGSSPYAAPVPPAPVVPTAVTAAYAPAAPQPPAAPAPYPAMPQVGYPGMPNAIPMPMPPATGPITAAPQTVPVQNEGQLNEMSAQQIRAFIESRLQ